MFKVWSERQIIPDCLPLLEGFAEPVGPGSADPDNFLKALPGADCVLAGGIRYNGSLMDQAPDLLVISRMGIGYENVIVDEATKRGIAVTFTPDGPTISTAEHAVSLIFAVAKDLKKSSDGLINNRRPDYYGRHSAVELLDSVIGLVGLGRIGSHVAGIMQAVGCHVVAFDPYIAKQHADVLGVERADSLESLLTHSDIVSLHMPLNDQTRHIVCTETLSQMKQGSILVNVSRGGLVDEAALLNSLDSGHLRGAGLDVTDPEPAPEDNPLLYRNDVIVTPHVGSASYAGKRRILSSAIDNLKLALNAEQPQHLLNPDVWPRFLERLKSAS